MKTRVNRLTATTKHSVILDAHPQEVCLSSTIFITGLQASTVYDFRVAAGNAKGLGPWSEPSIKIKTKIALPPPAPPRPTVGQVGSTALPPIQWMEIALTGCCDAAWRCCDAVWRCCDAL